jgi:hypothetical protein
MRSASTSGPTAVTTPAPSWFGTCSTSAEDGVEDGAPLRRDFQSVGFTPET